MAAIEDWWRDVDVLGAWLREAEPRLMGLVFAPQPPGDGARGFALPTTRECVPRELLDDAALDELLLELLRRNQQGYLLTWAMGSVASVWEEQARPSERNTAPRSMQHPLLTHELDA